jgi:hypothetical protein
MDFAQSLFSLSMFEKVGKKHHDLRFIKHILWNDPMFLALTPLLLTLEKFFNL